jgi:hypothetical protein
VVYDGAPEEVRAFLEGRLGTDDFQISPTGRFILRLPLLGNDRRPRSTGETTFVEVEPISEWSVEAPERGGLWHAIPRGGEVAYCTLDTAGWRGRRQTDDTHEVTCPWCRLRLIALEIVAPPGPRRIVAWHESCIYTMRHSDELAGWTEKGEGEAREGRAWRRGAEIFGDAQRAGTIVPVVFSAAEANTGLIYVGQLEDLEIDEEEGTSYRVRLVWALPQARPLSSLLLESTGEPLSDSYIRPYAICRTPSWLPAPHEQSPAVRSTTPSALSVAARGISLVVEEVRRRGGAAETAPAPGARNRLRLQSPDGRQFTADVKTRRVGSWQTDTRKGKERSPVAEETSFWVLVDLTVEPTDFYIIPEWWIQNDIYQAHAEYLAKHGGQRAQAPESTHHGITTDRVVEWHGRWELLGLSDAQQRRPNLHEEIARILREHAGDWVDTAEVAREVNAAGRYRKRDGSEVTRFQVHGRTRNYPDLFERDGSRVRLRRG